MGIPNELYPLLIVTLPGLAVTNHDGPRVFVPACVKVSKVLGILTVNPSLPLDFCSIGKFVDLTNSPSSMRHFLRISITINGLVSPKQFPIFVDSGASLGCWAAATSCLVIRAPHQVRPL